MIRLLLGQIIESVERPHDRELILKTRNGDVFRMYHEQDCCEDVYLEDIVGDLDDLIESTVVEAEEVINKTDPVPENGSDDSYTWTFYKLGTAKGSVVLRWFGASNGYYSEEVEVELTKSAAIKRIFRTMETMDWRDPDAVLDLGALAVAEGYGFDVRASAELFREVFTWALR